MYSFVRHQIFMYMLFLLTACSSDESGERMSSLEPPLSLTVVFATDGLGDMTYNDDILTGVLSFYNLHEENLELRLLPPTSHEQGEKEIDAWFTDAHHNSGQKTLLLLASSEWEQTLSRFNAPLPNGKQVIVMETKINQWKDGISAFNISLYGPCYLAGRVMAYNGEKEACIVLASQMDTKLKEGVDGFRAGMTDAFPDAHVTELYLSNDNFGYAMEDSAFAISARINQENLYDCILPLCGGSALGIYRYFNEYSNVSVVGMDADCSAFSYAVKFSVVRQVGQLIHEYLEMWLNNQELPKYRNYLLDDGYTIIKNNNTTYNWVDWEAMSHFFWSDAINKEKQYEQEE